MSRQSKLFILDMLENLRLCRSFVQGVSRESFATDRKTFYAVLRCLEVAGEASKNVPDVIRRAYPEIPWKEIAGLRDRLIHGYFGVNPDRVWQTVEVEVPRVLSQLEKVLKDLDEDESPTTRL